MWSILPSRYAGKAGNATHGITSPTLSQKTVAGAQQARKVAKDLWNKVCYHKGEVWGPSLGRRSKIVWSMGRGDGTWGQGLALRVDTRNNLRDEWEHQVRCCFFPGMTEHRTQRPWCSGLIFGDREGTLESLVAEGRQITLTVWKAGGCFFHHS